MSSVAQLLRDCLTDPRMIEDLSILSRYAANIKQERPIAYLLAQNLMFKNNDVVLEFDHGNTGTKADLVVNGMRCELKYHYGFDTFKIRDEIEKHNLNNSTAERLRAFSLAKGKTWQVSPGDIRDLYVRDTDIFISFFANRKLRESDLDKVAFQKLQRKLQGAGQEPDWEAPEQLFKIIQSAGDFKMKYQTFDIALRPADHFETDLRIYICEARQALIFQD